MLLLNLLKFTNSSWFANITVWTSTSLSSFSGLFDQEISLDKLTLTMVIKQQLQLSRKFENTSVREFWRDIYDPYYMIIWCHELVKLPANVYSYVYNLLENKTMQEHQLKANNHLSGQNILLQKCTCTDYLQL